MFCTDTHGRASKKRTKCQSASFLSNNGVINARPHCILNPSTFVGPTKMKSFMNRTTEKATTVINADLSAPCRMLRLVILYRSECSVLEFVLFRLKIGKHRAMTADRGVDPGGWGVRTPEICRKGQSMFYTP